MNTSQLYRRRLMPLHRRPPKGVGVTEARRQYRLALTRLKQHGVPSPKASDIRKVAPHLCPADAGELLRQAAVDRDIMFIGPPLRVQGAFHIFKIEEERSDAGLYVQLRLCYMRAARRKESYACTALPHRLHFREWEYTEAAQNFASKNWPDALIWDNSQSVMHGVIIPSPTDVTSLGQQGSMFPHFHAWLDTGFPEVLGDRWEPACELLNDAICCHEWLSPEAFELQGDHKVFTCYYCGNCGGGIRRHAKCPVCCADFTDGMWLTDNADPSGSAIPRYVLMNSPWQFPVHPGRAWLHDHQQWIQEQHARLDPIDTSVVKFHRTIDLTDDKHAS